MGLVSLSDLQDFLGIPQRSEDDLLQAVMDGVEAAFLSEARRTSRPFLTTGATGRVESREGTSTPLLHVDYPIAAVTAATIRYRYPSPSAFAPAGAIRSPATAIDETLDVTNPLVVVFTPGARTLYRVDGGVWGLLDAPSSVSITYDTQADAPKQAALAIKRVTAAVWQLRGSEEASLERTATYTRQSAKAADDDPIWRMAIESQWEPTP